MRCLNCGKDINHKHPNAKFCRNKGRGNCKDRYHNRTNPRGMQEKRQDDYRSVEYDIHPFDSDALGQW